MFGSFFDLDSLQCAVQIMQNPAISPLIVFFPINQRLDINLKMKQLLQNILMNADSSVELNRRLFQLHEKAYQILEKQEQALHNSAEIQYIDKQRDPIYQHHIALFGTLAARYLKSIVKFPTIWLNDHIYNGIPLNFSTQIFVDQILLQDILNTLVES
jgi:hypothetical protein